MMRAGRKLEFGQIWCQWLSGNTVKLIGDTLRDCAYMSVTRKKRAADCVAAVHSADASRRFHVP